MSHFAYSFCISLFHSLWQGGLLLLLYAVCSRSLLKNAVALAKRNFLFTLVLSQLALSLITFLIYFSGPQHQTAVSLNQMISEYLPAQNFQAIAPFVFATYLFAVSYKLCKTMLGWRRFKQLYKPGLQKAPLDLRLFTMLKAEQFCIKRPVKLLVSNTIQAPLTFGFFKPVILLPVALLNQITLQQAETLIIHELTHIKANDYLQNWIVLFAETVFFFNPFIIRICKKIKLEREQHCDTTVIHFKYSPLLYAQTLLQAEKLRQLVPSLQLAAVSSRQQLLQRIHFFADTEKINRNKKNLAAPLLLLFSLLFFAAYSILQVTGAEQKNITSTITDIPRTASEVPVSFRTNAVPVLNNSVENNGSIKIVSRRKTAKKQNIPAIDINEPLPADFSLAGFSDQQVTKQIIINEEASGTGTSTLKVYTLVFTNGEWVLIPGWMATSKLLPVDSMMRISDSVIVKRSLLQQ